MDNGDASLLGTTHDLRLPRERSTEPTVLHAGQGKWRDGENCFVLIGQKGLWQVEEDTKKSRVKIPLEELRALSSQDYLTG